MTDHCIATGKRIFHSVSHARRHAGRMMSERIRVYQCKHCHRFHITHEPSRKDR